MGCQQSTTATAMDKAAIDHYHTAGQAPLGEVSRPVVPAGPAPLASKNISNKVALGAGCFWGTQKYIEKDFQKKFPNSIKRSSVGFMSPLNQPKIKNPNYKDVCTGRSGHVEVLYLELNDPNKHFEELIRFFFVFHDPTLKDRQGNDRGFQYSSWIFYGDNEQYDIAKKVRAELQAAIDQRKFNVYGTRTVETKFCDLREFAAAGVEHQDYLAKNPTGYCNHRLRTKLWYEFERPLKVDFEKRV